QIRMFYPNAGRPGDKVLVGGKNFSTNPSENIVIFNSTSGSPVEAVVNSATDNELVVTVPETAVTGLIGVETAGGFVVSAEAYVIMNNIIADSLTNASGSSSASAYGKVSTSIYGTPFVAWEDKSTPNSVFDIFYTQWEGNSWVNSLINVTTTAE